MAEEGSVPYIEMDYDKEFENKIGVVSYVDKMYKKKYHEIFQGTKAVEWNNKRETRTQANT